MLDIYVICLILIILWRIKKVPNKQFNQDYLSIENCNMLKGLFAIIVIFHHLAQKTVEGHIFQYFSLVGYLAVSIFFFISGYGLLKKYILNNDYIEKFLWKRLPTILIPYLLMNIIYWGISFIERKPYSIIKVVKSFFNGYPIVENSWYIIVIVIYYIIFYLLVKKFQKNYKKIVLGSFLFCVCWMIICKLIGYGEWWYNSCFSIVFGMLWALYEKKLLNIYKKNYSVKTIFTILLFLVLFLILLKVEGIPSKIIIIVRVLTSILFTKIAILFSMKVILNNFILKKLGKISFELYMIHGLFIKILRGKNIYIKSELLYCFLVITLSIIFAKIIHHLFTRVMLLYKRKIKLI